MYQFSEDVEFILREAEEKARLYNRETINSEFVLLSMLENDNELSDLFNKYNIKSSIILKHIKKSDLSNNDYMFFSLPLKKIIDLSIINSKEYKLEEVNLPVLFLSMLEEKEGNVYNILNSEKINIKSLIKDLKDMISLSSNTLLNDIGTNLTSEVVINDFDKVIGREKEINRIIEILARKKKNNPLLIGNAGVGKSAIVEELAKKIYLNDVPHFLEGYKIISINVSSLVAGTKYRGEFEEKLDKLIKDLESNQKIILFIDEIHTIVGAGGAEGAIDASNILKPSLARGKIKVIGATTTNEYKKFIMPDKALDRRFDVVLINDPSEAETFDILMKIKKDYEKYHNVIVSEDIIRKIVKYSNKYIKDKHEPDKSIDILDEVCARSSICSSIDDTDILLRKVILSKNQSIKNNDYKNAINFRKEENDLLRKRKKNVKTKVSLYDLKDVLENKINSRIFELENKNMFNELKRSLSNNTNVLKKDICNFVDYYCEYARSSDEVIKPFSILINGENKVSKSLVKKLSEETKSNLINIDLKEYKSEMSLSRFIGSPNGYIGYDDNNTLFESLKFYKRSIILFENIEEAHPSILNLIKSILENGYITNSKGENIYFNSSFIILTENVNNSIKKIGFNKNGYVKEKNFDLDNIISKVMNLSIKKTISSK